ncbi:hypothetical protein [Labrys sp. WJW]|uniref:hypothetical protein n=1 Tax=Labrys sp. WJW TaxID=1737983 RepID=UPI0012EA4ED3|nr:hypothetical protein [Labrys sp. WJW]
MTLGLRWKQQDDIWFAYQGELVVGIAGQRDDGTFYYDANRAVHMRRVTAGDGEADSLGAAKLAVERVWQQWLDAADLIEVGTE